MSTTLENTVPKAEGRKKLFVAQATNTHLTLAQQLSIFAVATLTSKGASGVQGASFIALVGTLMVVPSIPSQAWP